MKVLIVDDNVNKISEIKKFLRQENGKFTLQQELLKLFN